jgi:hypothetical protein
MRRATLGEGLALFDAEAVLLVHDRDREITELDALLDQGVRADDDVCVRGEVAFTLRRGARQQRARHAEQTARLLEGEEVLLRECLRRCHQRALPSRFHGAQETVERDDGLAGPDLALQEPLHRHGALEIAVDLGDGTFLMLCELEREDVAVARNELARRSEGRSDLGLALPPPAREPELQQQELVERQPAASDLGLGERPRAVQGPERVDARGQRFALLQVCGERIRE